MEFSACFVGLFLLLFLFFYQIEKTRCGNLAFHEANPDMYEMRFQELDSHQLIPKFTEDGANVVFDEKTFALGAGPCPQEWRRYSGSCYKRFTKPEVTWNDARASCQQQGSDLVIIQSQEEQDFVFETYSCGESIWIGLVNVSRDYTWVNGDKLAYAHWSGGSPGSPGREHCVEIVDYRGYRGLWNDNSCVAKNRNFVCERGIQRGAFYRVIPQTSLDGHVMSRYITYSEIECAMKCESTTGCASVNFKSSGFSNQVSDKGICELNSVSIRESSSSRSYKADVAYLDNDT